MLAAILDQPGARFFVGLALFAVVLVLLVIVSNSIERKAERIQNEKRARVHHDKNAECDIEEDAGTLAARIHAVVRQFAAYRYEQQFESQRRAFRENITIFVIAITALLALASNCFFGLQWVEMRTAANLTRQSNEINRDAYVSVQRAFITIAGFRTTLITEIAQPKSKSWFVWPLIRNDGNTRTRTITYTAALEPIGPHFEGEPNSMKLAALQRPDDPETLYKQIPKFRKSLVLQPDRFPVDLHAIPGSWIMNSIGQKEDGTIWEAGNIWDFRFDFPYQETYALVGVIHYRDVFRKTDEHITKFCFMIVKGQAQDGSIVPKDGGLCLFWNCADDQCDDDKKAHDEFVAGEQQKVMHK